MNPFSQDYVCEDGKQLLYHHIRHFFLFYVENALKMRRMRMLENYAILHHHILSDALKLIQGVYHQIGENYWPIENDFQNCFRLENQKRMNTSKNKLIFGLLLLW